MILCRAAPLVLVVRALAHSRFCDPTTVSYYDQSVIVLVIFIAFSRSAGIWEEASWPVLLIALAICLLLLGAIFALAISVARAARLSPEDEIAAVFCGSKKSLASGLPLAQILFSGSDSFGLIVLPIILYNQVQILLGSVVAKRYARRPMAATLMPPGTPDEASLSP